MGCSSSDLSTEGPYEPSFLHLEELPQRPFNSELTKLSDCFKVSADFLFDSSDFCGHHGLFSKGDIGGVESGWLVNSNSGVLSVHLKGGQWQGKLQVGSGWNSISVEQQKSGRFILEVNGETEVFDGQLDGGSTSYSLKVGVQNSGNLFKGEIKNLRIQTGIVEMKYTQLDPQPFTTQQTENASVPYKLAPGCGQYRDTATTTFVCSGMNLSCVVGQCLEKVIFNPSVTGNEITFLLYERCGASDSYVLRWIGDSIRVKYTGRQEYTVHARPVVETADYKLGWKDGSPTSANTGSISWNNGDGEYAVAALHGNSAENVPKLGCQQTFNNCLDGVQHPMRSYRVSPCFSPVVL